MSTDRYEIKFILDQADLTRARTWLYTHTSARPAYDPRTVNSIYFDDPGYSSVRDNLAGISNRKKIRLRWYHNANREEPKETKLEVKRRNGRLGSKETYPLKGLKSELLALKHRHMLTEIQKHLGGPEVFLIEDHLFPALHVSYKREYLEGFDGGVRVTFDSNIKFHETLPHSHVFQSTEIPYPNTIMEIKFAPERKDEVSSSLRRLNLTPKRHSKYLVGLAALGQAIYY